MSVLYLIRHGQAGTRENYDSLSELGEKQAKHLGEYFRIQGIEFAAAYSGSLSRQRATAAAALPGMHIDADPGWDEFDLNHVYREYAPLIVADDPDFAREYAEMQRQILESKGAHDSPIHRKWNDCDKKMVRAWVESRYAFTGETWDAFVERIHGALARVLDRAHDGNVAVFTSATPIGVCAAKGLDLRDGRAMWLAGVLMNAGFTTLRVRPEEVRLFSLNNAPHLSTPDLRTFR